MIFSKLKCELVKVFERLAQEYLINTLDFQARKGQITCLIMRKNLRKDTYVIILTWLFGI